MFLINSQIPFLRNSSSMLEPILLPKLQIYFAEFPYDPYIHAFAKNLGYLMRSRYDYLISFSSGKLHCYTCTSSHNNPYTLIIWLCYPRHQRPSPVILESPQNQKTHYYKNVSVYTIDSLLHKQETLILYTNTFLLLLPRSAHITPPHSLTQILQQNNIALLLNIIKSVSYPNYIPSIFSNVRFGRYVVTRFLADANFHGHRPTVTIKPSDSYYLCLDYLSEN